MELRKEDASKKYSKTKIIISIVNTFISFAFLIVILESGFSRVISNLAYTISLNDYLCLLIFIGILGLAESIISFPLSFYSGYYLEHKYDLSNQKFLAWLWQNLKSLLVGLPIITPLILILFYFLKNYENLWWLMVGIVLFFFSIILARLAPVLILPLFYKFKSIEDGILKDRILILCDKAGVKVKGIFSFNMSKETKKANAGFTGIGKAKRIIIGDTLLNNFNVDEIEVVFAHELGHNKYGHIWKGMIVSTIATFLGLYLVSILYKLCLPVFGFNFISEIAALPLIGLLLSLYSLILMPLTNLYSRNHERQADEYAVSVTKNFNAFTSTMIKLGDMNLADKDPNPIIEFLFYGHPSINNRIKWIEEKFSINKNGNEKLLKTGKPG